MEVKILSHQLKNEAVISIESLRFPGKWIRQCNNRLKLEKVGDNLEPSVNGDRSFHFVVSKEEGRGMNLRSRLNPTLYFYADKTSGLRLTDADDQPQFWDIVSPFETLDEVMIKLIDKRNENKELFEKLTLARSKIQDISKDKEKLASN